jgi:hypothetical protein
MKKSKKNKPNKTDFDIEVEREDEIDSAEFSSEEEILRRMQPRKPGRPPTKFLAKLLPIQNYSDETEDSGIDMSDEDDSDEGFFKGSKVILAKKPKGNLTSNLLIINCILLIHQLGEGTPTKSTEPSQTRKSDRIGPTRKTYIQQKDSWEEDSEDDLLRYDLAFSDKMDSAHIIPFITPLIITTKVLEKIIARREKKLTPSALCSSLLASNITTNDDANAMVVEDNNSNNNNNNNNNDNNNNNNDGEININEPINTPAAITEEPQVQYEFLVKWKVRYLLSLSLSLLPPSPLIPLFLSFHCVFLYCLIP